MGSRQLEFRREAQLHATATRADSRRMVFLKMLAYGRLATVDVRGPSDYDLVCGWHDG